MKRILFFIALFTSLNSFSKAPLAIANDVATNICDDDGVDDGQRVFDLTTLIPQILGSTQSTADFDVIFYSDAGRTTVVPNPTNTVLTDVYATVVDKTNSTNTANSTVKITVIPQPTPDFDVPPICIDSETGVITNSYIVSGYSATLYDFEWKDNTGAVVSTAANFSTNIPGNYTLEIIPKSITGCSSGVIPFTVIESAKPKEVSYTVSNYFTENQTVTIHTVPYKEELNNFLYSLDGKLPQMSNVFENVKTGPHEVTVYDANGCGSITIPLDVQVVYNPKFFTPNGDGINDRWNILGLENQTDAQLFVFDKYGRFITQVFTDGDGWDGTLNGHPLPSSDYWFKINYHEDGVTKEYKSHFSLIR